MIDYPYIVCPRLDYRMRGPICKAVQNIDCPGDCKYNEHQVPFWERQNLTSKCSRPDNAESNRKRFLNNATAAAYKKWLKSGG